MIIDSSFFWPRERPCRVPGISCERLSCPHRDRSSRSARSWGSSPEPRLVCVMTSSESCPLPGVANVGYRAVRSRPSRHSGRASPKTAVSPRRQEAALLPAARSPVYDIRPDRRSSDRHRRASAAAPGRQHVGGGSGTSGPAPTRVRCSAISRLRRTASVPPGGACVFAGTRVPVRALFENIEAGASVSDFLEWFRASSASRSAPCSLTQGEAC